MLSRKYANAESIEDILKGILEYHDVTKVVEGGIAANNFDQDDNIEPLKRAIRRVIEKVDVGAPYRQHLLQLLREIETMPFEQTAELWEMVVVLLNYIKNIDIGKEC